MHILQKNKISNIPILQQGKIVQMTSVKRQVYKPRQDNKTFSKPLAKIKASKNITDVQQRRTSGCGCSRPSTR